MGSRSVRVALVAGALLASTLVAVVSSATSASAGVVVAIPVTVTADEDDGNVLANDISLREAVDLSNEDAFPNAILLGVDQTYLLTDCASVGNEDEDANANGDLDLFDGEFVTIDGNGSTVRQTCDDERVLHKLGADVLDLTEVTITGGTPSDEGGGVLTSNAVNLRGGTSVVGNSSFRGGGVYAVGQVAMQDSSASDNLSSSGGGGLYGESIMTLTRSSLFDNETFSGGGALFAEGDVTLTSSTVTGNMAANHGGVSADAAFVSYSTLVANGSRDGFGGANLNSNIDTEILASVIGLGGKGDDCSNGAGIESQGFNVGSDGSCGFNHATDLPGVYPHLVSSPDVVASGAIHPTVQQSLAIDIEPLPCDTIFDQRNSVRPVNALCDAGAYEANPPACTVGFSDVSAAHPFFDEICWMDQVRITEGFPDGTFKPSSPVTRQSMAAFIYRLAMSPPFELPDEPTFEDVSEAHTFFDEIEWMAQKGIATGFDGDVYLPAANVSRQAMSAFMYRVAGEPPFVPVGETFTDVSTTHPFYDEIEWMADEGISTGFLPGPAYKPSIPVSRQAMSAFLLRLAEGPELAGL